MDPAGPGAEWIRGLPSRLADLEDSRCLVLLGEMGLGKTAELQRHYAGRTAQPVMYVDLRAFGSMQDLERQLANTPGIRQWQASDSGDLTLALDSFDEAVISVKELIAALPRILDDLPVARLKLRIACRTAEWPLTLEHALKMRFASTAVYEIVPLGVPQIRLLAESRSVDPDGFLAEVQRLGVQALAASLVTLKFLLTRYKATGSFPPRATDLYEDGCRRLCAESDPERQASRRAGTTSPEERLNAATRVAAAMLFANRAAIWRGATDEHATTDLLIEGLSPESPSEGSQGASVAPELARETLATGLFSGRGPDRLGWSHYSYGEFLAARWASLHRVPIPQLEALFWSADEPTGGVIPQLHGVAAFLAVLNSEFRALLLRRDPLLLLRHATALDTDALREETVAAILREVESGRVGAPESTNPRLYEPLDHPALGTQLQAVISNVTASVASRRLALTMAGQCGRSDLSSLLPPLALDPETPPPVRLRAIHVLKIIGTVADRQQLLPLATLAQPDDIQDEVKGAALLSLWPDLLDPTALFRALTPPRRPNLIGAYSTFQALVARQLTLDMVLPGLAWLEPLHLSDLDQRDRLGQAIMDLAWEHLDAPGIFEPFMGEAWQRLRNHRLVLSREAQESLANNTTATEARRRRVLRALVQRVVADDETIMWVRMRFPSLVATDDLRWLVEEAVASPEVAGKQWMMLASMAFSHAAPEHFSLLWDLRDNPIVRPLARQIVGPISLDDPEVPHMRELARWQKEAEDRQADQTTPRPLSLEHIDALLALEPAPRAEAWPDITHAFAVGDNGRIAEPDAWFDHLPARPLWALCDSTRRTAIIDTAEVFVGNTDPVARQWYAPGSTSFTLGALAGIRAFGLLLSEAPERLAQLTEGHWKQWLGVLFQVPLADGGDAGEARRATLLQLAKVHAPTSLRTVVHEEILARLHDAGLSHRLAPLAAIWDDLLADDILSVATATDTPDDAYATLLEILLRHDLPAATDEVRAQAARVTGATVPDARLLAASRALGRAAPLQWWEIFGSLFAVHPLVGRELLLSTANRSEDVGHHLLRLLPDLELARFVGWLHGTFPPPDPDTPRGLAHSVTADEIVRGWRSRGMQTLANRGSRDAVTALRTLAAQYPQIEWYEELVREARHRMLEITWEPWAPQDILGLEGRSARRLVRTCAQLAEVVHDSLRRLEQELHANTRPVTLLWNTAPPTPKDEYALADYIAEHLRRDLGGRGIIANREVQLFRGGGGGRPGLRTDIFVDAVVPSVDSPYQTVSVIIEAKGSWNIDLITAMGTQLCAYLASSATATHGIYLVGHFASPRWSSTDGRRTASARHGTREELTATLDEQAQGLTTATRHVTAVVLNTAWD